MKARSCLFSGLPMEDSFMEVAMDENTTQTGKNEKFEEARQHMHAARENMHKVTEAMIPEGLRESQRAARKEFLLGLRSLVDAAIEHTEKPAK